MYIKGARLTQDNMTAEAVKPKVSVFGLGYVGSVMAGALAGLGHETCGVDINPHKVELINQGVSPIVEPGMPELIAEQSASGRLRATTNAAEAVAESELSFVCVGTPSLRNGRLDISSLTAAVQQLGEALATKDTWHTIAIRSTVLPGTIESVLIPVLERSSSKKAGGGFGICSNPEFMRESSALSDFFQPALTVVGADDHGSLQSLLDIYRGLSDRVFQVSLRSAEMIKYVSNAFHALKAGFANEIGTLARQMGIEADEVMNVFLSDAKLNISPAYLRPGFAIGGSCLPKDLRALVYQAKQMDLELPLLNAIAPSNDAQIERAVETILATGKRKIAFLGLSFKPGTDDLRESPFLELVKRLIGDGCNIRIYDPNVSRSRIHGANRQFAEGAVAHIFCLLSQTLPEAIQGSEVIVISHPLPDYLRAAESSGCECIINLSRLQLPETLQVAKAA
jgi:GDP-mannose 6-dehydrogenase